MSRSTRRVVTGHDAHGKSVIVSDAAPPQNHDMRGPAVGVDFHEIWSVVVQRGTDHAWENRGTTIARAAVFHLAAKFSEALRDGPPTPLDLMGSQ